MSLGPVQLVVLGFEGDELGEDLRAELDRLRDGDVIRLVDLLVVRRLEDGEIVAVQRSDLSRDEALAFGAAVGALIGLGAAGADGMEAGAVWGARELADGHVFDDGDVKAVAGSIEPGTAAALALIEHRWAVPLRNAVRRSGGRQVGTAWVRDEDLVALGTLAGLEPGDSLDLSHA